MNKAIRSQWVPALVSAGFAAALLLSAPAQSSDVLLSPLTRDLPSFELKELNAGVWNEESLKGKPYIVNFWATWCGPCVHELPAMNRAAGLLLDEGVGMVAVNLGEGSDVINAFMQKVPIDFPVLLGTQTTFPNWKVKGMPTTFIVSSEGQIVAEAVGPREWDDPEFIDYMLSLRTP